MEKSFYSPALEKRLLMELSQTTEVMALEVINRVKEGVIAFENARQELQEIREVGQWILHSSTLLSFQEEMKRGVA